MGRKFGLLVALLCLCFASGPVAGQGILVTPARLEAVLAPDGTLPPLYIENRTGQAVGFWSDVGWVSHDLYGAPLYLPQEWRTDVAVHIEPQTTRLEPGEGVYLRISVEPADRPSYPVIYLSFRPYEHGHADILRIAVPALLHTGQESIRTLVEEVSLESDPDGSYLHLLVANYGDAHVRAGGRVHLLAPDGELVATAVAPATLVLPGARRLISAAWEGGPLPWGEYRMVFVDGTLGLQETPPLRIVVGPDGLRQLPAEALTQIAQSESIQ